MGERDAAVWDAAVDSEDYSPSATLVQFDQPIPLLRGPLPAGASDNPSSGAFVLAFRDADRWRSAYQNIEAKITKQCLAVARMGCSVSASKKCRPPWWKNMFGLAPVDFAERERLEKLEMNACLEAAKEQCIKVAKEKCLVPFRDARIASVELKAISVWFQSLPDGSKCRACNLEVTNYRGSDLMEDAASEP